ncbi:major paralogous domain-containing protein [Fibrobacter sp. UWT3]|nr:major paralogous domain-containing protein [Fibrobacter sp. UWT3]
MCEDNAWREATTDEERECRENGVCNISRCTQRKEGKFKEIDGKQQVCSYLDANEYGWKVANCAEIKTGQKKCVNDDLVWACEDYGSFLIDYFCAGEWIPVSNPDAYTPANWSKKRAEYYTQEMHPDAVYGDDLVDARDGNVYKTVFIGGKRWMAENLRYADSVETPNMKSIHRSSWYSDDVKQFSCDNQDNQGCKYSWTAALDIDSKWQWIDSPTLPEHTPSSLMQAPHRGICPEGWHVPDTTEWKILGDIDAVALQMRGFRYWNNATDASGFSALPSCYYSDCSSSYWSISENENVNVYIWKIENETAAFYEWGKGDLLPIRCIQDYPVEP